MKKLPRAATLLFSVLITTLGCATVPLPDVTEPPPPAAVPPLTDLEAEYLPRIDDSNRAVDDFEARKEQIIAQLLEELEDWRARHRILLAEIDTRGESIALLEKQIAERRTRLVGLGDEAGTAAREEMERDLEEEIAGLEKDLERESSELEKRREKAGEARAEVERLETTDPEDLFIEEVRPLYREGIELHLGFYQGLIALARQELGPDEGESALLERFEASVERRRHALDRGVEPEVYADLRREVESDRRLGQAWLSAVIQEARFSPSESSLEGVSEEDREELLFLAEALAEAWKANPRLVMYIDGHADSKRFRGETACASAAKNRGLSHQRAETVKELFAEMLAGEADRIRVDWFGNFSQLAGMAGDELENRRIELRLTSEHRVDSFGSHREYFAMRRGLELAGRSFARRPGRWVETSCLEKSAEARVEHLSDEHVRLVERLGLDAVATMPLGAEAGRDVEVRLGNAFVVDDAGRCVEVVPCAESPD